MKYALESSRLQAQTSGMLSPFTPHFYTATKCEKRINIRGLLCEKRINIPGLLWKAVGVPKPL